MNDLVAHARGVIEGRRVGDFRTDATPIKPSSDAVDSVAGKAWLLKKSPFPSFQNGFVAISKSDFDFNCAILIDFSGPIA